MEGKWWKDYRKGSKEITTDKKSVKFDDLEALKVDDLHALQEDLAKKLELTNSLLQSKLTRQPHFESVQRSSATKASAFEVRLREGSAHKKLQHMNPQKKAELIHKAQKEFHEYISDGEQPTPQPQRRQPPQPERQADDELLSQKMQMYKEIQERVKGGNAGLQTQTLPNKGS
jgi:hypothetical protein